MQKEIPKKFFLSEIIPSELVALNCLIKKRILAIGTHCVRKQP